MRLDINLKFISIQPEAYFCTVEKITVCDTVNNWGAINVRQDQLKTYLSHALFMLENPEYRMYIFWKKLAICYQVNFISRLLFTNWKIPFCIFDKVYIIHVPENTC